MRGVPDRQIGGDQPFEAEVGVGRAGPGRRGQRRIGQVRQRQFGERGVDLVAGAWAAGEVVTGTADQPTRGTGDQLRKATPAFSVVAYRHQTRYGTSSAPASRCLPEEGHHGQREDDIQRDDHGQAQPQLLRAEEQRRPDRVERQLPGVQQQRGLRVLPAPAPPDQPGGDGHRRVEEGPDRAEEPVRRCPRRLGGAGVPAIDSAGAGQAADEGDQRTSREQAGEDEPLPAVPASRSVGGLGRALESLHHVRW